MEHMAFLHSENDVNSLKKVSVSDGQTVVAVPNLFKFVFFILTIFRSVVLDPLVFVARVRKLFFLMYIG